MKKFFKVCAIITLALAVVGGIFWGIGVTAVGSQSISDMVNKLTDGKLIMDLHKGIQIKIGDSSLGTFLNDNAIYNIEDADMFDKSHDIWKGDVEKTLLATGSIEQWNLELGGCTFELKDSGDESYYVEYDGKGKSQAYAEGNKLYVKVLNSNSWSIGNTEEKLTLYAPMNGMVEQIEVDLGAGQMLLDDLNVQNLVLNLGAGQVTAKKLQAEQISVSVGAGEVILTEVQLKNVGVEVGAGNCEISGNITGNVEAECAMGNLAFVLEGEETDFNYDLQCVSGNISLNDTEYSGLAQEQSIDNHATKTIELECAMGNAEILFE